MSLSKCKLCRHCLDCIASTCVISTCLPCHSRLLHPLATTSISAPCSVHITFDSLCNLAPRATLQAMRLTLTRGRLGNKISLHNLFSALLWLCSEACLKSGNQSVKNKLPSTSRKVLAVAGRSSIKAAAFCLLACQAQLLLQTPFQQKH